MNKGIFDLYANTSRKMLGSKETNLQIRHLSRKGESNTGRMINTLKRIGIYAKDRRMLKTLYWDQFSCITVQVAETDENRIKRYLRQGCVVPQHSNYAENIFKSALNNTDGIKIGGEIISNIR